MCGERVCVSAQSNEYNKFFCCGSLFWYQHSVDIFLLNIEITSSRERKGNRNVWTDLSDKVCGKPYDEMAWRICVHAQSIDDVIETSPVCEKCQRMLESRSEQIRLRRSADWSQLDMRTAHAPYTNTHTMIISHCSRRVQSKSGYMMPKS